MTSHNIDYMCGLCSIVHFVNFEKGRDRDKQTDRDRKRQKETETWREREAERERETLFCNDCSVGSASLAYQLLLAEVLISKQL